jgi:hypothetical protein
MTYGFSGVEESLFRQKVPGRVIREIVSSTRKLPARNSSSFTLFGVRGPPPGILAATSTIFVWSAGS